MFGRNLCIFIIIYSTHNLIDEHNPNIGGPLNGQLNKNTPDVEAIIQELFSLHRRSMANLRIA